MDTTHRKIELQSGADLAYLVNNASRCARERIDIHFPPSANRDNGTSISNPNANVATSNTQTATTEKDAQAREFDMRKRVEELVAAYLDSTYQGVRANVSVNGLEGRELDGLTGESEGMSDMNSRSLWPSLSSRSLSSYEIL